MNGLYHLVKGFNLGLESFIDIRTKSSKNDYFSFFSSKPLTIVEPVLTIVMIHSPAHNLTQGPCYRLTGLTKANQCFNFLK